MVRVAISVGSNIGDRAGTIHSAVELLRRHLSNLTVSSLVETEPVDVPDAQPRYLNAALSGDFDGTPRQLLDALMTIERDCGRQRPYARAARTLDLDLILFGERVIDEPGLRVPHPRFRERAFVLRPLAEIAPDARDPVTGLTIASLYDSVKESRACA